MIITPILITFLVLVSTLLFLFLNTVDNRKWLSFLISLILTPFIYFYVFYPLLNIFSNYHHQKYFDSDAWNNKPALRYEMIDHVITSDTLMGLNKIKVRLLLGNQEWFTWDDATKKHKLNQWNYSLGIEPGAFNKYKDCLEITFKEDTVVALKIHKAKLVFSNDK